MANLNNNGANESYEEALRRQQEYARRKAAYAAQQGVQAAAGQQAAAAGQQAAQQQQAVQQQQQAAQPPQAAAQQQAAQTQQYGQAQQPAQAASQQYQQQAAAPTQQYAQAQPTQQYAQAQPAQQYQQQAAAQTPQYAPAQMASGANYGYTAANRAAATAKTIQTPKKKKHMGLRVFLIILAILLVAALGVLAYATWYTGTIANNISMSANDQAELSKVLTSVNDLPQSTEASTGSDSNAGATENQQKPYYVLLIGSDNWEGYGERSDALLLIRVDQANHKVTMVSIPRDTPYQLNGQTVKINEAFAQEGPVGAVTAVQQLTGVSISYYAEIEFAGLSTFVDTLGGITVNVPYTIDYNVYTGDQDTVHIEAGEQVLNGAEVVALARMRTAYDNSIVSSQDAMRQANVRAMTVALMNAVIKAPITEIPGLVQQLSSCVSTTMDIGTLTSLALDFAQANNMTLYTCTGPYDGALDESTGLWLCYENPEGWATLMAAVDAGEDPETAETQVNGN